MNEKTIEILKLVSSFLTPLIILILGIVINKKLERFKAVLAKELESAKAVLSKEKDWENWWAGKFLNVCHDYNDHVSDVVTRLFQAEQIEDEKLSEWDSDIRQSLRKLQYLDWEIQNYIQFAHQHGPTVLEKER